MNPNIEERTTRLLELGLRYNGQEFFKDDINVHNVEVTTLSDSEFDELVNKIKVRLNK
jgi:hypothetical protein